MLTVCILFGCIKRFLFVVFSMVTTAACVTLQFSHELPGEICYSVSHTLDLGHWLDKVLHMTRFLEGTDLPIPTIIK